jgi:hypothetical protein
MEFLNAKDMAGLWWLNVETLLTWIARGSIPAPQFIDGHVRWDKAEIDRWEIAGHPRTRPLTSKETEAIAQAIVKEFPEVE